MGNAEVVLEMEGSFTGLSCVSLILLSGSINFGMVVRSLPWTSKRLEPAVGSLQGGCSSPAELPVAAFLSLFSSFLVLYGLVCGYCQNEFLVKI